MCQMHTDARTSATNLIRMNSLFLSFIINWMKWATMRIMVDLSMYRRTTGPSKTKRLPFDWCNCGWQFFGHISISLVVCRRRQVCWRRPPTGSVESGANEWHIILIIIINNSVQWLRSSNPYHSVSNNNNLYFVWRRRCAHRRGNWENEIVAFVLFRHLRDAAATPAAAAGEWTMNNVPHNNLQTNKPSREKRGRSKNICIDIRRGSTKSVRWPPHAIFDRKIIISDANATSVRRHCNRKLCAQCAHIQHTTNCASHATAFT